MFLTYLQSLIAAILVLISTYSTPPPEPEPLQLAREVAVATATPTPAPAYLHHAPVNCSTPVNVSRGPRLTSEAAYDLLLSASNNPGWSAYYRDVMLYAESGLYTLSVSPTCDFGWTQINYPSWRHLYNMTRVLYDAAYAAEVAWDIYSNHGNQWYGASVPMGARPY